MHLLLNDGGKLVKEFPHIPGIDFSGTVVKESENNNFKSGDKVIYNMGGELEKYFTLVDIRNYAKVKSRLFN